MSLKSSHISKYFDACLLFHPFFSIEICGHFSVCLGLTISLVQEVAAIEIFQSLMLESLVGVRAVLLRHLREWTGKSWLKKMLCVFSNSKYLCTIYDLSSTTCIHIPINYQISYPRSHKRKACNYSTSNGCQIQHKGLFSYYIIIIINFRNQNWPIFLCRNIRA